MALLKQSTARNRVILMIDSSDHVTGKTGLTLTTTAGKDGGAFASISPTVTDLGSGFYNLAFTTGHSDTLGDLAIHITGSGADPTDFVDQVVLDLPGATITTVANLTNAPTAGDLTAAMKASVTTAATAATPTAAAVTADVGITQAGADKVWGTAARTLTSFGTLAADVWAVATRVLTAGTNIVLAKGTGVTGFNDLDAAGVRGAVGLALANLDTQLAGISAPSAATVADAVWDEALAGHAGAGSAGLALASAGSAGDPWATLLPGPYTTGMAGKIVGDNLNATLSSRATQISVDDVPTNSELATALGTADDAVLAAVATAQTGIDAIPTNAELATALGTADDAVLAAIGSIPAAPTTAQIADKILGRNLAGGSDGGRMVKDALRSLRNKTSITAGTLTVTEEDDTTPAWTAVVTTNPGDPLTSIDPA